MPFGSEHQLAGPDYLIGAAEQRKSDLPFAEEFQQMVAGVIMPPDAAPGLRFPTEPPRELEEHEQTAVLILAEATRMAIAKRDWESVGELLGFGVTMALLFDEHLRVTMRLPSRIVGIPAAEAEGLNQQEGEEQE